MRTDDAELVREGSLFWERWIGATFLRSICTLPPPGDFLPASTEELEVLLNAYILEKALYEVGYELNNRPEWIRIPIEGILRILDERPWPHLIAPRAAYDACSSPSRTRSLGFAVRLPRGSSRRLISFVQRPALMAGVGNPRARLAVSRGNPADTVARGKTMRKKKQEGPVEGRRAAPAAHAQPPGRNNRFVRSIPKRKSSSLGKNYQGIASPPLRYRKLLSRPPPLRLRSPRRRPETDPAKKGRPAGDGRAAAHHPDPKNRNSARTCCRTTEAPADKTGTELPR